MLITKKYKDMGFRHCLIQSTNDVLRTCFHPISFFFFSVLIDLFRPVRGLKVTRNYNKYLNRGLDVSNAK